MKQQAEQELMLRQIVNSVSRETRLPYKRSLECIRSSLRSLQTATQRYGQIDLSVFGLEGISARTEGNREDVEVKK